MLSDKVFRECLVFGHIRALNERKFGARLGAQLQPQYVEKCFSIR